jgi:hypothetical protein
MATRMQQRKGTAAQWISTNSGNGPVLNAGEIGFEIDTNKFKIGDGINHWADLVYFTDSASALAAINAVIDAAPAALNTLNELAAAINDDPAFFTTMATNLANHEADTTNVHGIADTALLATKAYADQAEADAIATAGQDATTKANNAKQGAETTAANALSAHEADTTNVHGIPDTAFLATKTYADSAVSTAVAALTKSSVGLSNVDNTSDANKPVSTATQAALDLKANAADITELSQDAVNSAIVAGVGLDKTYDDLANTITIDIDSTVATKAYADAAAVAAVDAIVSGAPTLLNTLDELAAAMGDDPAYLGTIADNLSALNTDFNDHTLATTDVHGIADVAALATKGYVDTAEEDAILAASEDATGKVSAHNSETINVHGIANTANLATKEYADNAVEAEALVTASNLSDHNDETINVHGIADTSALATTADTSSAISQAIGMHDGETLNVHGIEDTSLLATQDFVASAVSSATVDQSTLAGEGLNWNDIDEQFTINTSVVATKNYTAGLLLNSTQVNIAITGDEDGLTITAENGVADSTTDNLSEGTNNKYFTDERAQDAVGNAVGTGLSYNDATGSVSVDTTAIQARVADVSDTEIGYLNGVTSAIQTQIDTKAPTANPTFTGTVAGVTKAHVGLGNADNTSDADKPLSTAAQTALDLKAPLANPTFTGTVAGVTKAHVGLGNADNTSDANKPISTATQTALDLKAPLASPTLTGTTTTTDLVVNGDFTVNGTNFAASATSITIEDNLIQISHSNPANTVDLGLVVGYNDGASKHAGIARDVSESKWKLFKGVSTEPTTTVAFSEGSLDDLAVAGFEATSATIGDVSNTELQYLNGVTSSIQTQIDTKAPTASPTFTGTVTIPNGASLGTPASATLTNATGLPVSTGISGLGTGVATFLTTPSSANLASMITDEIGTGNIVLSEVSTNAQTASYTLVAADRGKLVEMNVGSANTLTVPLNSSVPFPIGTQIDILQVGSGKTTVAGATVGVTINATPGLAIRAQWGGATLIKRGENTWVLIGDLATA